MELFPPRVKPREADSLSPSSPDVTNILRAVASSYWLTSRSVITVRHCIDNESLSLQVRSMSPLSHEFAVKAVTMAVVGCCSKKRNKQSVMEPCRMQDGDKWMPRPPVTSCAVIYCAFSSGDT